MPRIFRIVRGKSLCPEKVRCCQELVANLANLYDLVATITMPKINTILWNQIQVIQTQCSKCLPSKEGERDSSSKIEREALLLFKAKLCVENWQEYLDLSWRRSPCPKEMTHCPKEMTQQLQTPTINNTEDKYFINTTLHLLSL